MTDINFGKALEAIRIIYDPLANNNLRLEAYQVIPLIFWIYLVDWRDFKKMPFKFIIAII